MTERQRTTLGEFVGMTPDDLAEELGLELEQARRLAAEPVYGDDLAAPAPGEELQDALEWGRAIGTWCECYDIVQVGRLIGLVQDRLGRRWVRW
ncbi:MAG TPA: hypothetical protein VNO34_01935 [Actinomycetota bacterium]|nr:hypothetical protein [Actinomycetota bacterium]